MIAKPTSDRPVIVARLVPVADQLRVQTPAGVNLTSDTRKLKTGDVLMACVPGNVRQHGGGHPYTPQAIEAGASTVLVEAHGRTMPADVPVRILPMDGLARLARPLVAQRYGMSNLEALHMIDVTGTDDETSCS